MFKAWVAAGALAALVGGSGPAVAASAEPLSAPTAEMPRAAIPGEQRWRFRVLLDEREIGFHDFAVLPQESGGRVEIDAQFDVRVLFINAYRYRHSNVETWRGDCLASIRSTTDDNGDLLRVEGASQEAGFRVDSHAGDELLKSDCVRSFAYWDRSLLAADRLLNAQTGEWLEVSVEELGPGQVRFGDAEIPAVRYRLALPDGRIDLWYGRDGGQWLALESPTAGGRLLRYEPVELPELPLAANRVGMN